MPLSGFSKDPQSRDLTRPILHPLQPVGDSFLSLHSASSSEPQSCSAFVSPAESSAAQAGNARHRTSEESLQDYLQLRNYGAELAPTAFWDAATSQEVLGHPQIRTPDSEDSDQSSICSLYRAALIASGCSDNSEPSPPSADDLASSRSESGGQDDLPCTPPEPRAVSPPAAPPLKGRRRQMSPYSCGTRASQVSAEALAVPAGTSADPSWDRPTGTVVDAWDKLTGSNKGDEPGSLPSLQTDRAMHHLRLYISLSNGEDQSDGLHLTVVGTRKLGDGVSSTRPNWAEVCARSFEVLQAFRKKGDFLPDTPLQTTANSVEFAFRLCAEPSQIQVETIIGRYRPRETVHDYYGCFRIFQPQRGFLQTIHIRHHPDEQARTDDRPGKSRTMVWF